MQRLMEKLFGAEKKRVDQSSEWKGPPKRQVGGIAKKIRAE